MLTNPDILGLIERTRFEELPDWTAKYYAPQQEREFVSSAKVTLADGRTAEDMRPVPHGHPKNPLSDADIESKFTSMADPVLRDHRAVLDAAWNMESADDVSKVMSSIKLSLEH